MDAPSERDLAVVAGIVADIEAQVSSVSGSTSRRVEGNRGKLIVVRDSGGLWSVGVTSVERESDADLIVGILPGQTSQPIGLMGVPHEYLQGVVTPLHDARARIAAEAVAHFERWARWVRWSRTLDLAALRTPSARC